MNHFCGIPFLACQTIGSRASQRELSPRLIIPVLALYPMGHEHILSPLGPLFSYSEPASLTVTGKRPKNRKNRPVGMTKSEFVTWLDSNQATTKKDDRRSKKCKIQGERIRILLTFLSAIYFLVTPGGQNLAKTLIAPKERKTCAINSFCDYIRQVVELEEFHMPIRRPLSVWKSRNLSGGANDFLNLGIAHSVLFFVSWHT